MFSEEAVWIKEALKSLDLEKGQKVMDIGSATESYRCLSYPYIDYYVFRPLRERGISTVHVDAVEAEGVDVVWNTAEKIPEKLGRANAVICASLLEHVADPSATIEKIKSLIEPGGYIILTVPNFFPYHAHPIDTMYRPTNRDLELLFPGYEIIKSEILPIKSWWETPVDHPFLKFLNKGLKKLKVPFIISVCPAKKVYKVSIIAARKPAVVQNG